MDFIDGFLKNAFTPESSESENEKFSETGWACHLLDQDINKCREYIDSKLEGAKSNIKKLEFLHECKSCFRNMVGYLKDEMSPDFENHPLFNTQFARYRGRISEDEMRRKLAIYERAIESVNIAIEHINCCPQVSVDAQAPICANNSQTVLILYYFLKCIGVEPREGVDVAPFAKFLHLITGKDFTTIQNSDFYKKLRNAPNHKRDKDLIEDLQQIKHLFQKVDLMGAVKLIDDEIRRANRERTI